MEIRGSGLPASRQWAEDHRVHLHLSDVQLGELESTSPQKTLYPQINFNTECRLKSESFTCQSSQSQEKQNVS